MSDYANVECVQGALTEGWEQRGPYDAILVDGAVEHIPQALVDQLADGGRLTSGLIEDGVTRLVFGRKLGDAFGTSAYLDAQATQLPGFERPREFVF